MIRNILNNTHHNLLRQLSYLLKHNLATTTIIQNQYNFCIDFKGLLYFDDGTPMIYPNCVKDKKFINQLYKNLQWNPSQNQYPFVAEFWGERNQIRCAISPIIFHSLQQNMLRFSFEQEVQFQPDGLKIDSQGRIWHPFRQDIFGVFSNDMLVAVMDHISTQPDGRTLLKYEEKQYQIQNMHQ